MANGQPRHWLDSLLGAMSPSSWMTPEMGSLMATDPEAAARHLAAQGVPPPRLPVSGTEQSYPQPFAGGMNGPNIMGGDGRRPPVTGREQAYPPPFGGGLPGPRPGTTYTPPEVPVPPPFGRLREQFSDIGSSIGGGLGSLMNMLPRGSSGDGMGTVETPYNDLGPSAAPASVVPSTSVVAGEQPGTYNPLSAPVLTRFPQPAAASTPRVSALTPQAAQVGAPMDIRSDIQKQQDAASRAASGPSKVSQLAKALSGVKAPAEPAFQKISSPAAPRPVAMPQGSPIATLLAKAVAGDPMALMTLRTAIDGGR